MLASSRRLQPTSLNAASNRLDESFLLGAQHELEVAGDAGLLANVVEVDHRHADRRL
jgi:hypothetical protein